MKKIFFKNAVKIDEFNIDDTIFDKIILDIEITVCKYMKKGWEYMISYNQPYYMHIYRDNGNVDYFVFVKCGIYYIKTIYKSELQAEYHKISEGDLK